MPETVYRYHCPTRPELAVPRYPLRAHEVTDFERKNGCTLERIPGSEQQAYDVRFGPNGDGKVR